MRRLHFVTWFMALLVLSCASFGSAPNVLEVKPDGEKKVAINDKGLAKKITFGNVISQPLENGMKVQVMLQNLTKRDVNFEYRFIWYDASGMEVSSQTAWQPSVLGGMEEKGFTSTTPTANAVDFKLMIRAPHGITDTSTTY